MKYHLRVGRCWLRFLRRRAGEADALKYWGEWEVRRAAGRRVRADEVDFLAMPTSLEGTSQLDVDSKRVHDGILPCAARSHEEATTSHKIWCWNLAPIVDVSRPGDLPRRLSSPRGSRPTSEGPGAWISLRLGILTSCNCTLALFTIIRPGWLALPVQRA